MPGMRLNLHFGRAEYYHTLGLTELDMTIANKTLMELCKLYKGGEINPYTPFSTSTDNWAMEYLKFHVWDAELAFVANYEEWLSIWQHKENKRDENDPKSVYCFVINCKLGKMQREDIDFWGMYHKL